MGVPMKPASWGNPTPPRPYPRSDWQSSSSLTAVMSLHGSPKSLFFGVIRCLHPPTLLVSYLLPFLSPGPGASDIAGVQREVARRLLDGHQLVGGEGADGPIA